MKCAYKEVLRTQKLERLCNNYGTAFLKFCDASLAVNLHELFGFGAAKRLNDLFSEQNPRLNEQMLFYMGEENEDIWETTQTTYYGTRRKIHDATGWNPEDVTKEMPVPDNWKPTNKGKAGKREADKHLFRTRFVESMEYKLGVYWNMTFLYLITDHQFGAERLTRLYKALRRDYISFAAKYLEGAYTSEKEMFQMIHDMQERARAFGLKLDYGTDGNGVPVRKES